MRPIGLALACVLACGRSSRSPQVDKIELVVVQPQAGEVWTEGGTYTIRWRATGIARINVGLALGGKDKGHPALDLPSSPDSLRWTVPAGFVSGFGLQRSDLVRVRVEDAGDPTRFADSPSFTILAPPVNLSPGRPRTSPRSHPEPER